MSHDVPGGDVLHVVLSDLRKFTAYSVKILAYTRMGDGKQSLVVMERTDEDGRMHCNNI